MIKGMRKIIVAVLGVVTAAIAPSTRAQIPGETVSVMSNAADRNEVIAFCQSADGHSYETGRFDTRGRGSGGITDPLQSQGSLRLSRDHTLLFVANAGSGTVSVFRVLGPTLFLVDQMPSGGSEPLSVAQFGNLVYVLNSAGSGSIVAFNLRPDGHLRRI